MSKRNKNTPGGESQLRCVEKLRVDLLNDDAFAAPRVHLVTVGHEAKHRPFLCVYKIGVVCVCGVVFVYAFFPFGCGKAKHSWFFWMDLGKNKKIKTNTHRRPTGARPSRAAPFLAEPTPCSIYSAAMHGVNAQKLVWIMH
jgi:hypothetical protein